MSNYQDQSSADKQMFSQNSENTLETNVDISKKSITVVLGMARSGTSAITAGLECLGIALGDNLLPPNDDNIKGFFEDIDFYELNVDLMAHFNQAWDSLVPISEEMLSAPELFALKNRAKSILIEKTNKFPNYGIKDPRMCQLLPFWKSIFDELDLEVNYIIAVRDPSHVAESLVRLNWTNFDKGLFLWFNSMVFSMCAVVNKPHIVVQYDDMLLFPKKNLERISQAFNLELSPEGTERYVQDFLDKNLNGAAISDSSSHSETIPEFITECFAIFKRISIDQVDSRDPNILDYFQNQAKKIYDYTPLYRIVQDLECKSKDMAALLQAEINKHKAAIDIIDTQSSTLQETQNGLDTLKTELDQALKDFENERKALHLRIQTIQNENSHLTQDLSKIKVELDFAQKSFLRRSMLLVRKLITNISRTK